MKTYNITGYLSHNSGGNKKIPKIQLTSQDRLHHPSHNRQYRLRPFIRVLCQRKPHTAIAMTPTSAPDDCISAAT